MTNVGSIKAREIWIDNEKGIFLFLIVLGHFGTIPKGVEWLLSPTDLLYVSAFFFLSGWLFNDDKYSKKEFFYRKFQSLFIPYVAISLLVSVLDWNLYLHPLQFAKDFIYRFLMGDGAAKASPLWFVSTLFIANLLLKIGYAFKNRCLRSLFFISMPFLCYYLYFIDIRLPLRADSALGACFIMYMSQIVKGLSQSLCNRLLLMIAAVPLLVLGIYLKLGLLNYNSLHSVMSFPCAVGGCVSISFFMSRLLRRKIAPPIWIAQNGLPVLGFHCLLSFYVDVPFKLLEVSNTDFVFVFKIVFVFSMLYFIVIPVLERIKPRWWGLTGRK